MITLVLGGEGYLNFMGNEFGHPGKAQALYLCTRICARLQSFTDGLSVETVRHDSVTALLLWYLLLP